MEFPSQHQCNKYCTWMDLKNLNDANSGKGKGKERASHGDSYDSSGATDENVV
jgi:hypothetical protein